MPSFNFFKGFGSSKTPLTHTAPIIVKDYAHVEPSIVSPVSQTMATGPSHSRPPEIIKSEPILTPSLGRRGTLKKKVKHRPHISEDASPGQWIEPLSAAQDDLHPRPPPISTHQSLGYQSTNESIYPAEYPYPYEDHHQQRFQYNTTTDSGAPPSSSMPVYENGPPPSIYPDRPPPHGEIHPEYKRRPHNRHRHRHRHHRHHYQPPQQDHEHGPSYILPTYDHDRSPDGHDTWGHDHNRSRSRSYTPIPTVYREPDSMELEGSYANPLIRDNHLGHNDGRRSGHGPDGLGPEIDGHGLPQALPPPAMIGWHPNTTEQQMDEEQLTRSQDPEGTLVGDNEPQIITPPVESDNPLGTNVYHTREPDFQSKMRHRRKNSARGYAHQSKHHDRGESREPQKKAYMYRDYHHSETIEPRMYERGYPEESGSDSEEYRYIVPSGVHVVFRDHDGNAIARIGHPGPVHGGRHRDMTAFTVQDEYGNILYRHGGSDGGRFRDDRYLRSGNPRPPRPPKVIMIDERGNQIPLKSGESYSSRSHHSHKPHFHHSHHSHHSHRSQRSHHSQHSHPSEYSDPSQHSHPSSYQSHSSYHLPNSEGRRGH